MRIVVRVPAFVALRAELWALLALRSVPAKRKQGVLRFGVPAAAGKMDDRLAQIGRKRCWLDQEGGKPALHFGQDGLVAEIAESPDQERAQRGALGGFARGRLPSNMIEDGLKPRARVSSKDRLSAAAPTAAVQADHGTNHVFPNRVIVVGRQVVDKLGIGRRRLAARLDQRPGVREEV